MFPASVAEPFVCRRAMALFKLDIQEQSRWKFFLFALNFLKGFFSPPSKQK
jgi:hypothetical protein